MAEELSELQVSSSRRAGQSSASAQHPERQLRVLAGWTQEDPAHAASLIPTYVGQGERGDKMPSLTVVVKLARGLDVAPGELLAGFTVAVMRKLRL